jgi:hypothetical protein
MTTILPSPYAKTIDLLDFFNSEINFKLPNDALVCLNFVHKLVVNCCLELELDYKKPPSSLIKNYFKFRHNVFGWIMLYYNGIKVNGINTDCVFPDFVQSNKTPDFIYFSEDDNSFQIFEFTVVSRFAFMDQQKGGGLKILKYKKECDTIISFGYECELKIYGLALYEEIPDSLILNQQMYKTLNDFKSICLFNFHVIARNFGDERDLSLPESLLNSSFYIKNKLDYENINIIPNMRIFNINYIFIPNFNSLKNLRKPQSNAFISINSNNLKVSFLYDKSGCGQDILKEFIDNYDLPNLIPFFRLDRNVNSDLSNTGDFPFMVYDNNSTKIVRPKIPVGFKVTEKQLSGDVDTFSCNEIYDPTEERLDCFVNFTQSDYLKILNLDNYFTKASYYKRDEMLCNNEVTHTNISKAIEAFKDSYRKSNFENVVFTFRPKQTFTYPIPVGLIFGDLDLNFLDHFLSDDYTSLVLRKIIKKDYTTMYDQTLDDKINDLKNIYNINCRKFHVQALENYRKTNVTISNLPKEYKILKDFPELTEIHQNCVKSRINYISCLKFKSATDRRCIKLKINKKGIVAQKFKKEMETWHSDKGEYIGVGGSYDNIDKIHNWFWYIKELLLDSSGYKISETFSVSNFSHQTLKNLKCNYKSEFDKFEENFSQTNLSLILDFLNRLCKTLLYFSSNSKNINYVMFDNLGYKNFLLLVRGGKKIHRTDRSKLFKLFFPINFDISYTGWQQNNHFKIVFIHGLKYLVTPWMSWKSNVITDGISLKYRVRNFLFNSYISTNTLDINMNKIFPIILAFCNRRKIEGFMHNMRYLMVNPLGEFSTISGIITSFASFNYTYLECWIREKIYKNYHNYATYECDKIKAIKNIDDIFELNLRSFIHEDLITNQFDFTISIYSTYLMTKAPYNKSVEQGINLLPIMQDIRLYEDLHYDVKDITDDSLYGDLTEQCNIYEDDFKYNKYYCQMLGFRVGNRLKCLLDLGSINSKWVKTFTMSLIDIANANGLRGYNKSNFFNKKGYEVVASFIKDFIGMDKLNNIIEKINAKDIVPDEILELDNNLGDFIKKINYESLKFHVVDKVQRGLGREIFVMDIYTKIIQNPIEKMFSFFCKYYDNEYISVSSDKRVQKISKLFFEKKSNKENDLYYFVLDCRRWAPHSVLQKYIHMISGMSFILPKSFKDLLLGYLEFMINKKIFITRDYAFQIIKNNISFTKLNINLITQKYSHDDLSVLVKFSFVMGIHNYLSSLMHAENQLFAAESILHKTSYKGFNSKLKMIAHSDDSAGVLEKHSNADIKDIISIYECHLKLANHMCSIKKSQINKGIYFEFLSILFLKREMLPVTIKFSSSMNFNPTDKGIGPDLSFAGSQAIEMLQNGSTMSEAYISLKLTSNLIYDYYNIKPNDNYIYSWGGLFDPHPIELLLSGTDTEILRHIFYNPKFTHFIYGLNSLNILGHTDVGFFNIKWDMGFYTDPNLINSFKLSESDFLKSWTVGNLKSKNLVMSIFWFISKLSDRNFYASLINTPNTSRICRLFGAYKNRNVITTTNELVNFNKVMTLLEDYDKIDYLKLPDLSEQFNFLKQINENLIFFWKSLPTEIEEVPQVRHSLKPILIDIRNVLIKSLTENDAAEFVSYHFEPEYYKLLKPEKDCIRLYRSTCFMLDNTLLNWRNLNSNDLYKLLLNITTKNERVFRAIQRVGSGSKMISDFSDILSLVFKCSYVFKSFNFNYKTAYSVDSEFRGTGSDVKIVYDFLNIYQINLLAKKHNVENFVINIDEYKPLYNNLPLEWKIMCQTPNDEMHLYDLNYCILWLQEQKLKGTKYIGNGSLLIKIPEGLFSFKIFDDKIIGIETYGFINTGILQKASHWFLEYIVDRFYPIRQNIHTHESWSDMLTIGKDSYGNWSYSNSSNLSLYFKLLNSNDESSIGHLLLGKLKIKDSKIMVNNKRVYTIFDSYYIKKLVNINDKLDLSINLYLHKKNVQQFLYECNKFKFTATIDKNKLIGGFTSSLLYKIYYRSIKDDYNLTFIDLIRLYKIDDNTLGFPDDNELLEISELRGIPLNMNMFLKMIESYENEIPIQIINIVNEACYHQCTNIEDLCVNLARLNSIIDKKVLTESIILKPAKSKNYIYNMKFTKNFSFLLDIYNEINEIICDSILNNYHTSNTFKEFSNRLDLKDGSYSLNSIFNALLSDIIIMKSGNLNNLFSFQFYCQMVNELIFDGFKIYLINCSSMKNTLSIIDFDVDDEDLFCFIVDVLYDINNCTHFDLEIKNVKPFLSNPFQRSEHKLSYLNNVKDFLKYKSFSDPPSDISFQDFKLRLGLPDGLRASDEQIEEFEIYQMIEIDELEDYDEDYEEDTIGISFVVPTEIEDLCTSRRDCKTMVYISNSFFDTGRNLYYYEYNFNEDDDDQLKIRKEFSIIMSNEELESDLLTEKDQLFFKNKLTGYYETYFISYEGVETGRSEVTDMTMDVYTMEMAFKNLDTNPIDYSKTLLRKRPLPIIEKVSEIMDYKLTDLGMLENSLGINNLKDLIIKALNSYLESNEQKLNLDIDLAKKEKENAEIILSNLLSGQCKYSQLNLITDPRLKAEENALMPGLLDLLLDNNIQLTENNKKIYVRLLRTMKNQILESNNPNLIAFYELINNLLTKATITISHTSFEDFISDSINKIMEITPENPISYSNTPMPDDRYLNYGF